MKELERRDNLERAYEYMKKHVGHPLTHDLIKSIHGLIGPGYEYRSGPGSPPIKNQGKRVYLSPPSDYVLGEMQKLFDWYNLNRKFLAIEELASKLHWGFVKIHPFDDGNGRTARILFSFVFLAYGFVEEICNKIEIYCECNKKEYYNALDDGIKSYSSFENVSLHWMQYVQKLLEAIK